MPNQPFDYRSQAASLARRRALVDAMLGRSMQPLESQTAGGLVVPTGSMSMIAKVMDAWQANKQGQELDQAETQLNLDQAADTRRGMEQFYQTSRGRPIMPVGNMPAGQVPADPRRAIFEAMASNNPELQTLGREQFKADLEGQLTPKDLSGMATPSSVLGNPTDPNSWIPKVNLQNAPPGEVMLDEGGSIFTPGQGPRRSQSPFPAPLGQVPRSGLPSGEGWETVEINGDLFQRTPTGLRKLDNAANVSTTVNTGNGESSFDRTLGEAEARRLSAAMELRPQMLDAVNATTKGLDLLNQGIHTGILGPAAMNLERLDAQLFNSDPAKSARTQEFISYIGDVVIPGLKSFGGSDTVEEMKYLQQVSGGDVSLEPEALARILKSVEEKTRRKLTEVDAAVEAYRATGRNLPTMGLGVLTGVPDAGATTTGQTSGTGDSPDDPMTLEQLYQLYPRSR